MKLVRDAKLAAADNAMMQQLVEQFKISYDANPKMMNEEVVARNKQLNESLLRGDKKGAIIEGAYQTTAKKLYEKYSKYVGDMPDMVNGRTNWTKSNIVFQMANWENATNNMKRLEESTFSSAINVFQKFAFPLIRAVLPELATEKLFNIQTMFGPTSNIFYFDYVYGTTTGTVTAGQSLFENNDPTYGNSEISLENGPVGNGVQTLFVYNLDHTNVLAGTVTLTDGVQISTDDANGNLVGDGVGTINYATGAVSVTWGLAIASGINIEASYSVDTEGNTNGIPEVDLVLTTKPVQAQSKKIRFRWSFEAQFSLRDQFGLEAESELLNAAGAEIGYGIDIVNIQNVQRVAIDKRNDVNFQFTLQPPTGVSRQEHYQGFPYYLIKISNLILTESGRAIGNRVVGGDYFTSVVENIGAPRYVATPYDPSRGVHEIGTLDNRWICFRALFMNVNEYLVLYKSDDFLRAGYVWAPWITAFTTPTAILDDFAGRKGIGSLFGSKVVNNLMFVRASFNTANSNQSI